MTTGRFYSGSSPRNDAGGTSGTPSRSSRISPTRSSGGCGRDRRVPRVADADAPDITPDRRHRRRHRIAAPFSGGAPGPPRPRPRELDVPPRLPGAYLAPSGELKPNRPSTPSPPCARSACSRNPCCYCGRIGVSDPIKLQDLAHVRCRHRRRHSRGGRPSICDIPKVLHRRPRHMSSAGSAGPELPGRRLGVWDELLRRVTQSPAHGRGSRWWASTSICPTLSLSVTGAARRRFHDAPRERIRWVTSDSCETESGCLPCPRDVDAILVPGGFGIRGIEGKGGRAALGAGRGIPTLGICLGLQCMVIEYARTVAGIDASSSGFDPRTPAPVIATMADQLTRSSPGAQGIWAGRCASGRMPKAPRVGSVVADALRRGLRSTSSTRHRYEVNNRYRDAIAEAALRPTAIVEFVELPPTSTVLRRDAGTRVQVPSAPRHPAVRGVDPRPRRWTGSVPLGWSGRPAAAALDTNE